MKKVTLDLEKVLNDTKGEVLNKTMPGRDLGLRIEDLLATLAEQISDEHDPFYVYTQITLDDFWDALSGYLHGAGNASFTVEVEDD